MSFPKALALSLVSLGLASALPLLGCSSDGGSSTPPASCNGIDFAAYKTKAPVSFRTDVMPIFGQSCTLSSCHSQKDHKAGLNLGVRCATDASGKCTFPATADPDSTSSSPPAPLTDQILADVRTSLLAKADTVNSGTVMRVVPNDPANSFLINKLDGSQAAHGPCTNQDPSHAVVLPALACGDVMPLGADSLCASDRPRFDIIATWIAQGAPAN